MKEVLSQTGIISQVPVAVVWAIALISLINQARDK